MLARVRESLFAILGDVIGDAAVLDLFSGTGSLGLEALSRGARSVRFLERDRRALARLAQNVELLGVGERTRVVRGDALDPRQWGSADERPDVALMDPPYPMFENRKDKVRVEAAVRSLIQGGLADGGVLVLHTHPRVRLDEDVLDGATCDRREYGNTALWFLWREDAGEPSTVEGAGEPQEGPAEDPR